MSHRLAQINELLKEELSKLILQEIDDDGLGLLTITKVETAPDLSNARVWISCYNPEIEEKKVRSILGKKAKSFRTTLKHTLSLKRVPYLNFKMDPTAAYVDKIENLLNQIKQNKEK